MFRLKTVERGGIISPWRTRDRVRITVSPSSSQAPTAVATASVSTLKFGETVTFSASSSSDSDGEIVAYEWKDANGTVLSTQETFTHTFATTGTHTLTLTVTDNDAQTATDTVSVTVNELQAPIAHINASATQITVNSTVSFDANGSSDADGEIVSYTWLDESNTTLSNLSAFSHTFSTSGVHTITLKVMDDDSQETSTSVDIVVEAVLDSLTLSANTQSLDINESTSLTATAHYSDGNTEEVSSSVIWNVQDSTIATVDANGTLTALQAGSTTVSASIGSVSSSALNITVNPPVVLSSIAITPNPVEIRVGSSLQLAVTATYSDQSTQSVDVADYTVDDASIISIDPTGTLEALQVGSTSFRVKVGSVYSGLVFVTVGAELNTTNFNFTNFGSTYTSLIPIDATQTQYDEKRFCMIAGQVKAKDQSPLSGVRVSIHRHPEYGTVLTDANGTYAIPAEGGLQLIMHYTKQGYTTIDRKVLAPAQDWVRTPDVTMLAVDSKVTQVTLGTATPQVHTSTKVTDEKGSRSTTLVFDGVSRATVTAPDGTARILTDIAVRATEFETPKSMPSDLPKESAFTYCSDLTVDGVKDDEEVSFDAPVVMYVDNFLGFDVGEIVPVGYYDRKAGAWKASDNGVVVKLLDTDGDGKVDALDSTGDDSPNDLNSNGIFSDEVSGIANNPAYQAGKSYWRAEITHFTPWDHNWPYGPPFDAVTPNSPDINTDDDDTPPNDCQADISSYVTKKSRVFHEDIPVAGMDITLHYSSKRVGGNNYVINSKVDTTSAPASTLSAVATLEVGGKIFTRDLDLGTVNQLSFVWDGKDALGSNMSGEVIAKLTVKYIYNMVYYRSSRAFYRAWARAGSSATAIRGRTTYVRSIAKEIKLNVENAKTDNSDIAKGWTLSNHDSALLDSILRGNGNTEKQNELVNHTVTTVAGNEQGAFYGDGGDALLASLYNPQGLDYDKKGNLYIADNYNCRIRKVNTAGIISTVAGNGQCYFSSFQEGTLATNAVIGRPTDISVDGNGNLYIVFSAAAFIYKVANDGIITKIAGKNGDNVLIGDGGYANETKLENPTKIIADDVGNIYILEIDSSRVRKIDTEGIINTVAGGGHEGNTEIATNAILFNPVDIALDRYNNLYIACKNYGRVYRVSPNGKIETFAGGGYSSEHEGDGGKATDARLMGPTQITLDSVGNLYINDSNRIRKVDTHGIITTVLKNDSWYVKNEESNRYKNFDISGLTVDNEDNLIISDNAFNRVGRAGSSSFFEKLDILVNAQSHKNQNNTADIFDKTGKHLKLIDLYTGNALKTFTYDENKRLVSITDQFGNVTTITRDANGYPTSITAPNGQVTTLTVDENGDLVQVAYEDGSKYEFSYFDGSLMDTMTDPNGNVIYHNWDAKGRIVEEIDGLNGSYQFLRNVSGAETLYSTVLPEGETSTSKDVRLANGDTQSTMTLPTGETVTATFAKDESKTTSLRDGVSTTSSYTIDLKTQKKIPSLRKILQPSGLKQIESINRAYTIDGGDDVYGGTQTQISTINGKTSTTATDYSAGTNTLTTPENRVATRTYDVNTLLTTEEKTGTLTPTTYTYDSKGRVTKETTGTRETSYTYDNRGNLATITDPRGQTTTYSYDIVDNLIQVSYPNGTTEHFTYDKNHNLLTRTVPTPAEHRFSYNGGDLRTNYTSPENKATTYSYDKSKNLTSIVKPSGKTITNTYSNGRLESTQTPEGTTNYSYFFASKVGSITTSTGSATDESFTYTYDGTLLTKTVQAGVLNHTTEFSYNNDFQVTSSTYAGATESYTYDNDGLLLASGDYTLTRDPQNAYVTNLTDGTLTQSRSYNSFGEITEVSDNTFTYQLTQRDNAGAIVQKKETLNGVTETFDYIYDNMGRLTASTSSATNEVYTYDNNGNRASATVNGTSITASYTLDDNLKVYGDNTYLYDEDGYLKTKTTPQGATTYTYGTRGELLSVTTPTSTGSVTVITYKHNALNQRVAKLVNGQVVEKYLWKNLTTLLAIYDKDDNLKQRFEYADQRMPISMTQGSTKYYLHYDQVGSLRAISDTNHNIIKEISYDTFGNILSDSNPSFTVPFGFAGGLYDADTKLTRFGYRDYDAYTGKWTAKDPIGFSGGDSNLYGYVLGDPVNFVDPEGLCAWYEWLWSPLECSSKDIDNESDNNTTCPTEETKNCGEQLIDDRNECIKKAATSVSGAMGQYTCIMKATNKFDFCEGRALTYPNLGFN